MKVEGLGGIEEESGRHAWGRGGGAGLGEVTWKKPGSEGRKQRGDEEPQGNGRSWELPCWRFPYCLSVCHGISLLNKEEFK